MKPLWIAIGIAASLTVGCGPHSEAERERRAAQEIEADRAKRGEAAAHAADAAAGACEGNILEKLQKRRARDIRFTSRTATHLDGGRYRVLVYVNSSLGPQSYVCTLDTADGDTFTGKSELRP